jgi:hypothetical protein
MSVLWELFAGNDTLSVSAYKGEFQDGSWMAFLMCGCQVIFLFRADGDEASSLGL